MTNKELSKIHNECLEYVRENGGNILDLFETRKSELIKGKQKEKQAKDSLFSMEFLTQEFPIKDDRYPKKSRKEKKYVYPKTIKVIEPEKKIKIIESKFYTVDEVFKILKPWRTHIYSDDRILALSENLAINLEKNGIQRKNPKGEKLDILTIVKPYKLYELK